MTPICLLTCNWERKNADRKRTRGVGGKVPPCSGGYRPAYAGHYRGLASCRSKAREIPVCGKELKERTEEGYRCECGGAPPASRHIGSEQRDIPQQQASLQVWDVAYGMAAIISPTGVGGLLRPRGEDIPKGMEIIPHRGVTCRTLGRWGK